MDVFDKFRILNKQVESVHLAASEWVHMLLAVHAKVVLTVLAASSVVLVVDRGDRAASRDWAPAHIVHRINSGLQTLLFVLLEHLNISAKHILDIMVVKRLLAISYSAAYMSNLSSIYLLCDHGKEALVTKEMLTAGQESELFSKKATLADLTCVLFRVETSLVCSSCQLTYLFHLGDVLKSELNVATVILDKIVWILCNQIRYQLILDLADHLVNRG